jgi:Peptidase A4 family
MLGSVSRRSLPLLGAVAVVASLAFSGGVAGASASAGHAAGRTSHVIYGTYELSNWGGYVAPGSSGEFTTVTASWTEASATCRNDNELYAPWVGIDGYGNETVEQTGVQTSCSTGKPVDSAWYEMYPKSPVYYSKPVSTGDKITATVTASGGSFTLTITDKTKDWTETTHASTDANKDASAEAVIEAPGGYPTLTSVDFTKVQFDGKALDTYSLVKLSTDTDSPVTYHPTAITHTDDFKMVPKS